MVRRRRLARAAAAGAAGLLLVAGCGSDDGLDAASDAPGSGRRPAVSSTTVAPVPFEAGVLAQAWLAHGRFLGVHEDGTFELSYRTYRWCSASPPPCDEDADNQIGHGGYATGTFHEGAGPVWRGTVDESVEPDVLPPGPVVATYDAATDTLDVRTAAEPTEPWVFCGNDGDGKAGTDPRCGA